MRNFIMKSACTLAGATVGFLYGTTLIPVGWALDLVAPVSFPLLSAVNGYAVTESKRAALVGGVIGMAFIPLAPLDAITKPVTAPLGGAIMGGIIGFSTSKRVM